MLLALLRPAALVAPYSSLDALVRGARLDEHDAAEARLEAALSQAAGRIGR